MVIVDMTILYTWLLRKYEKFIFLHFLEKKYHECGFLKKQFDSSEQYDNVGYSSKSTKSIPLKKFFLTLSIDMKFKEVHF